MHKSPGDAVAFVSELRSRLEEWNGVEVVVCPSFVALVPVSEALRGSKIHVAGQNVHWEAHGAYTGEVSPTMLKDAGCRYVIVGHSERRAMFGETDETVNKKVKACLDSGLRVIVCVGESLEQRERGETFDVVQRQVRRGLEGIDNFSGNPLVVAYEPVWAIGTGHTASPEQAQEVHAFIRGLVQEIFGQDTAGAIRIQYGGSVKPDNIDALMAQNDIDGALVGGASLELESFARIVKFEGV